MAHQPGYKGHCSSYRRCLPALPGGTALPTPGTLSFGTNGNRPCPGAGSCSTTFLPRIPVTILSASPFSPPKRVAGSGAQREPTRPCRGRGLCPAPWDRGLLPGPPRWSRSAARNPNPPVHAFVNTEIASLIFKRFPESTAFSGNTGKQTCFRSQIRGSQTAAAMTESYSGQGRRLLPSPCTGVTHSTSVDAEERAIWTRALASSPGSTSQDIPTALHRYK